jgi:hypothetical protein
MGKDKAPRGGGKVIRRDFSARFVPKNPLDSFLPFPQNGGRGQGKRVKLQKHPED